MQALLLLLLFPLVWPFVAKAIWKRDVSWKEVGINIVIVVMLVSGVWYAGRWAKTADTEVWNGEVTGKEKVWTSCEHSYPCNPYPCNCDKNGCSTCWHTCYEHANDWNWTVRTNIGNVNIARIDRRGSKEPPRFTQVKLGEPVSLTYPFTNYIKAVPESLFHAKGGNESFLSLVPPYPLTVYDYFHVDRVLAAGVNVPDLAQWNRELPLILRDLGPKKQANVVILFVNTADQNYVYALEKAWLGGKKNDIVLVVGTSQYPKIDWVHVMSWTKEELFKINLRESVKSLGTVDRDQVLKHVHDETLSSFQRRHMKEFEYLKYSIEPPTWVTVLAALLAIGGSVGLSIYFKENDPFDD